MAEACLAPHHLSPLAAPRPLVPGIPGICAANAHRRTPRARLAQRRRRFFCAKQLDPRNHVIISSANLSSASFPPIWLIAVGLAAASPLCVSAFQAAVKARVRRRTLNTIARAGLTLSESD
jgi:hypothetical protein